MLKKVLALMIVSFMLCPSVSYAKTTEERLQDIEDNLPKLKALISQCEQQGFDMGYEQVDCSTIEKFIRYGREDIEMGDLSRSVYVADCLEEMYDDATSKARAYLDGNMLPKKVVRNKLSDNVTISGSDFVKEDGAPAIFNGYGHFGQVRADLDKLQKFGGEVIQIEIGPYQVINKQGEVNGWLNFKSNVDSTATIAVSDGGVNGAKCLKLKNPETEGYVICSQEITVKPNTKYNLSFSARTVKAVNCIYGMMGLTGARHLIRNGTNVWTEYTDSYTTGADETTLNIYAVAEPGTSALYVDNFVVTEDGSTKNIVQNGSYEENRGIQSEHFEAYPAKIRNWIVGTLDEAEKNDVRVSVLLSPHYFHAGLSDEMVAIDSGYGYDIKHEITREYFRLYIKAVMQEIAGHKALDSICILNEPRLDSRNVNGIDDLYSNFISDMYSGDISELNELYGTNYTDFSEVKMPTSDTMDVAFYDWIQFNDEYYGEWYRFMVDEIKKYTSAPVFSKTMIVWENKNSITFGADPEKFAEFCDLNGNDCWGFYNGYNGDGLMKKNMWYTFLKSLKDLPVINSEDHITVDWGTNYDRNHAIQIGADMWQGATHGRDSSAIWLWERVSDRTNVSYGNIMYRPDAVSIVGKRSLDINRLSGYVAALQKSQAKASILYSQTTQAYSRAVLDRMFVAYKGALFAGANPDFITEKQLAEGKKPAELLIVAGITNLPKKSRDAIKKFKRNGGKVLALYDNCLSNDEKNRAFSDTVSFDIRLKNPDQNAVQDAVMSMLRGKCYTLYDTSGVVTDDVDINVTTYDHKKIINLCMYDWSGNRDVIVNGESTDLLTGEKYNGVVTLKPFVPVLLETYLPEPQMEVSYEANNQNVNVLVENKGDASGNAELWIMVRDTLTDKITHAAKSNVSVKPYDKRNISYEWVLPKEAEVLVKMR